MHSRQEAGIRSRAASDGCGILSEVLGSTAEWGVSGVLHDARSGAVTAYHRTPGYETYRGLGWYGVIVQTASRHAAS